MILRIGLVLVFMVAGVVESAAEMVSPGDSRLAWTGRVDFSKQGEARYDWAGVQLAFNTEGGDLDLLLADGGSNYNLFVDGKLKTVIVTEYGKTRIPLSLGKGKHQVLLHKRHDGNYGIAAFQGLDLKPGTRLLDAPALPKRKIEFIGDSNSVGYGVEGPSVDCVDKRPYENNWKAWTSLTGRAVNAQIHVTAISGKGVIRNYGETTTTSRNPLPYYYERTAMRLGDQKWNFRSWVPDVIVVKLGSNDHSTEPKPSEAQFLKGLSDFMARVRALNGDKIPVFLASTENEEPLKQRIQKAVQQQVKAGYPQTWYLELSGSVKEELGCDWHAGPKVHQRWSETMVAALKDKLRW